jgi:hypothetical protein
MTTRATAPPPPIDYPGAIWLPAQHWSPRPAGARIRLVVLHCTQPPGTYPASRPGAARSTARFFAADPTCEGSAHYVCDPRDIYQCVQENRGAWGAKGGRANAEGIHVELCGRVTTDWSSGDGLAVLERAAPLVADILRRHALPCRGLDASGVRDGEAGMCTHAAVTQAYCVPGGHIDPGGVGDARWPWELWLELVEARMPQDEAAPGAG